MTSGASDRATRFRGEGRPKRRLSPSPPPPTPSKTTTAKTPAPKKSTPKQKESSNSVSKKGASAKKKARSPTPDHESEEEAEESLPVQLKDRRTLPTLKERQPVDLSLRTYKSISESGVLNAALDKSRQRWLTDGLFEKFWVKYSRKNKDEPAPSSQSMTKLNGECYMIIEPHSFKITLFTVKASPAAASQDSTTTSKTSTSAGSNPSTPLMPSWTQPTLPPPSKPTATVSPSTTTQIPKPEPEKAAVSTQDQPPKNDPAAAPPTTTQHARPEKNAADPVIQMLAARAATDNELKSLMKIVAQGHATQDQLSVFQRHIDELNGIIQAQKHQASGAGSNTAYPSGQSYNTATFHPPHTPAAPAHLKHTSVKQEPFTNFYHPTAPPMKPKVPVASKPVLGAIVFEFAEASGTRYLLPKNSILEYLPGNTQVLMSFLITRKGDAAAGGKHRSNKEYYQPVTVRLMADNAKLLEPLTRVVAPPEEVRRQMSQQMETLELAEDAYLALRLPRSTEEGQATSDNTVAPKAEVLRSRYDAPNSLLPIYRPSE